MLYDIIIIGAGPSGIIAAIESGKKGFKVCLIDQNSSIGKKLSITGGGRCNVTSNIEIQEFESNIPQNYKFLQSSLKQFSNLDLILYLKELKIETKSEGKKVYLKTENGKYFVKKLENTMTDYDIKVMLNTTVEDIIFTGNRLDYIKTDKGVLKSKEYLIASGGLSYPELGSDGSILNILSRKNIFDISKTSPTLVPINLKKHKFTELSGVAVEVSLILEEVKMKKKLSGELLFTHNGISGPLAINFSSFLVSLSKENYDIWIDFMPKITESELLNELKIIKGKERLGIIFKDRLPKKLIKVLFPLEYYDFSNLNKKQISEIITTVKKYHIEIEGFEGYNKAIVTRGGIDIKEVDPKTMKSKKITNLYFAGEILDVDGFTGGYNLQIAFSTGYVVGKNIGGI